MTEENENDDISLLSLESLPKHAESPALQGGDG
jgi:hypothetical protein